MRADMGRSMTFPVTELTNEQRRLYETYIDARRESECALREPLWLALVLACEKPGVLMVPDLTPPRSTPWDAWEPLGDDEFVEQPVPPEREIRLLPLDEPSDPPLTIEEVLTAFDLPSRTFKSAVCVARTSWLLDLVPTSSMSTGYHRRLGTIFGYPRRDIEYFITKDASSSRITPADLIAAGHFQPEALAYTTFIPQLHEDSIAGYERAIETGRQIRATITTLANQWDLPALDALADTVYERTLTDYQ